MATTVISAFSDFLKDSVNLDPDDASKARGSRDWLVDQINGFPGKDSTFPTLYKEKHIFFGSFARKTKIRPLDDVDIMTALSAQGSTYSVLSGYVTIYVHEHADTLLSLCHVGTSELNSRKVINKFISSLNDVPQYDKAEIHRNQEAATLKLKSYPWNFDIVPCFFTSKDLFGRDYYLIPDGSGYWKKTDPRKDRDRVSQINQKHNGNVLNVIRTTKYWNKRPTMPSMGSYLLENMVLNFYENRYTSASSYVDLEMVNVFNHLRTAVYSSVQDPKGIQGDLNQLSIYEKGRISERAAYDWGRAKEARELEEKGEIEKSIKKWAEIFGSEFPSYG